VNGSRKAGEASFDVLDVHYGLWQWMGKDIGICLRCFSCMSVIAALDQTQQVRRKTLAKGKGWACCLLSQLWPATPSALGHWGVEQTGQATGRCLDSGCGQWEVEEGKEEANLY